MRSTRKLCISLENWTRRGRGGGATLAAQCQRVVGFICGLRNPTSIKHVLIFGSLPSDLPFFLFFFFFSLKKEKKQE